MIYYYLLKFTLEINIFSLIAFLSGIFAGFVILGLIYFIGCLRSITKKKNKINKIINEISQEEIKEIIFKNGTRSKKIGGKNVNNMCG